MVPKNFSPAQMQLVNILVLGRSGSFFFQGLLEGHPNIVALPVMRYVSNAEAGEKDVEKLARAMFDAWMNFVFVHEKTDKEIVAYGKFREPFLEYLKTFGASRKNVFIAIHYAYAVAMGRDTGKITYIAYQGHAIKRETCDAIEDFPGQKLIFLVRDPRATYVSLRLQKIYQPLDMMAHFYFSYQFALAYPRKENVLFVGHEELHLEPEKTMRRVCGFLCLPYHEAVLESSFYGMPYTGKSLVWRSNTGVFSSKPDKKYVNDKWKGLISQDRLDLVNFFFGEYIKRFKYETWTKSPRDACCFDPPFSWYLKKYANRGSGAIGRAYYAMLVWIAKVPLAGNRLSFAIHLAKTIAYTYVEHMKNKRRVRAILARH